MPEWPIKFDLKYTYLTRVIENSILVEIGGSGGAIYNLPNLVQVNLDMTDHCPTDFCI